jgi:hypothetical protein
MTLRPTNLRLKVASALFGGLSALLLPLQSPTIAQLEIGNSSAPEILVVGAEKTQKLRLKPIPGASQAVNIVWQIQTSLKAGDREMPNLAMPTLLSSLSSKVNEIAPNGDIRYQVIYNGVQTKSQGGNEFEAQMAKAIEGQLGGLAGLRGDYVMSEQGEAKSAQMTLPENLTAMQQSLINQFAQAAASLSAPFPANSVGIGGVWRQVTPIMIDGMQVQQTATYRLLDLKDGIATIGLQIEQTAAPQKIQTGNQSIGALQLKSFVSEGKGQMIWDLKQVMPQQSQLKLTSTLVAEPENAPGANNEITTRNLIDLTLTSN